jgi:hypothetical protein
VQQGDNTNDILQLRAGNGQAGTGSQHVTVTGTGNLLVGTTSPYGTNVLSVNGGIAIDGRNASTPGLSEKSDPNTGIFWPTTDTLAVTTAGTERMRIDAYGGLAIKSVGGATTAGFYGGNLVNGITAVPSGSGTPFVLGRDTGTLRSAHFGGNLKFDSGYGVQFSVAGGGTSTSGTLDDYEEGTFTPEVQNGTYTYSNRRGHYVKIGNMVYVHIGLRIATASSVTSAVGRITGLPFTSMMYGSYQEPHARIEVGGGFVTSNLGSHLSFYVDNNQTRLLARTSAVNADTPVASNAMWQNGTFIKLTVIYTVS